MGKEKLKGIGKGKNPNSLKNLQPMTKGEPARSLGRPVGSISLKERLKTFLELPVKVKMPDGVIQDKSAMDRIILSLLNKADKGDVRAIEVIFDRYYGKEAERVNVFNGDFGDADLSALTDEQLHTLTNIVQQIKPAE